MTAAAFAMVALLSTGLLGAEPAPAAPPSVVSLHIAAPDTAPKAPRKLAMTTINLHVNSCPQCPITLQQSLDDRATWISGTHHVRDGEATFHVPTWRTHGMAFVMNPEWANVTNAATVVVTRYSFTRIGQSITNAVARHKKKATGCWAGTGNRYIVLHIRAVKFDGRALGGGPGHALRAWFNPMATSTPYWDRTFRGSLGTQEAYPCDR
jgi:hypothetical protein